MTLALKSPLKTTLKATRAAAAAQRAAARAISKAHKEKEELIRQYEDGTLKPGVIVEINGFKYTISKKTGLRVRVTDRENKGTFEDARRALRNMRVFEAEELTTVVGEWMFLNFLGDNYFRKDARGDYYWITKRGAALLGLERPVIGGVVCEFPA
jgi:hypothetical protein